MTIIELNDVDAAAFMLFREHQAKLMLLIENRVFDLRNGSAEIHFNPDGDIAAIDMHAKVFKRAEITMKPVVSVKKVL